MKTLVYYDNRQEIAEFGEGTERFLNEVIEKTLDAQGVPYPREVSVSIVGPVEIKELNRDFRGIDSVTDVLSFPMEEVLPDGTFVLGDIIINMERVLAQAGEYGHSPERELSYLTVHSLLHLLGYDHEEPEERLEMRRREKEMMNLLQIYRGESP